MLIQKFRGFAGISPRCALNNQVLRTYLTYYLSILVWDTG